MTNIMVRPEDAFNMGALVGVAEVPIVPLGGVTGNVPTRKNKRCVYGIVLTDLSGVANWVELRVYRVGPPVVLEVSVRIPLVMNDTLPLVNPMNSPIFSIEAGKSFRAIAGVASVQVACMTYDL